MVSEPRSLPCLKPGFFYKFWCVETLGFAPVFTKFLAFSLSKNVSKLTVSVQVGLGNIKIGF